MEKVFAIWLFRSKWNNHHRCRRRPIQSDCDGFNPFYSNRNAYVGWYVLIMMMITVCVYRRQSGETFIGFRSTSTPRINFMILGKLCVHELEMSHN